LSQSLARRIDAIEGAYEFFLAYAAQGVKGQGADGEVRAQLEVMRSALTGLAAAFGEKASGTAEPFVKVLGRDADSSLAAVNLVLAQEAISSQLIDNLNASIHIRALLTDIFLLDETQKP
jgi:hypothetical protein